MSAELKQLRRVTPSSIARALRVEGCTDTASHRTATCGEVVEHCRAGCWPGMLRASQGELYLGAIGLRAAQGGRDVEATPNLVQVEDKCRAPRLEHLHRVHLWRVEDGIVHGACKRCLEVHLLQGKSRPVSMAYLRKSRSHYHVNDDPCQTSSCTEACKCRAACCMRGVETVCPYLPPLGCLFTGFLLLCKLLLSRLFLLLDLPDAPHGSIWQKTWTEARE